MKLTGFPIYLVAICLSLYLLSLTFINGLDIASKLTQTPPSKAKEEINKFCEDTVFLLTDLGKSSQSNKESVRNFLVMKEFPKTSQGNIFTTCYEILYK
jgi:hypothetical protein